MIHAPAIIRSQEPSGGLFGSHEETTPYLAIGDSWLTNWFGFASLRSALKARGYADRYGMNFTQTGRLLRDIANPASLDSVESFFDNLGSDDPVPACILLGGGGNDVCQPTANRRATPLYRVLQDDSPHLDDPLVEAEVKAFIDNELHDYLATVVDRLKRITDVPILVHAYDHPVPDGRGLFGTAWLGPVFEKRGMTELEKTRKVMQRLIDRLNGAVARVASENASRVHHVKLTGILASDPRYAQNYQTLWNNELHPTADGYDLLAEEFVRVLQAKRIGQLVS